MNGFERAAKFLYEWGFYGTFSRPDNSGIRGTGGPAAQGILAKRAGNFPYDNDDDEFGYGQPNAYDRGSRGAAGQLHQPLTPKDVRHSAWDDAEEDYKGDGFGVTDEELNWKVQEAMGSPENFGISGDSEIGSMIPGTNGHGWNGKPMKPWDKSDNDGHCEIYGDENDIGEGKGPMGLHPDGQLRKPQKIPNAPYPQDDHETAGEDEVGFQLELSDPSEFQGGTYPPSEIAATSTSDPFMQGQGRAQKLGRGRSATGMWQEARRLVNLHY